MKIRTFAAAITSVFPYSMFEAFIFLLPLILIFLLKRRLRIFNKKTFLILLAFISFSYAFNIALPSKTQNTDAIRDNEITERELLLAADDLISEINSILQKPPEVPSELPCGAKRSIFSRLYTALGIYGLYYFSTAEYVVNGDAPMYIEFFSAAHEYAHFNSVMREDEATLFAYKLLSESEEPFYRYSAALYAYETVAVSLRNVAPELYAGIADKLCESALADIASHTQYAEKYKSGALYKLSKKMNSMAISLYDERGGLSYSSSAGLIAEYILYG